METVYRHAIFGLELHRESFIFVSEVARPDRQFVLDEEEGFLGGPVRFVAGRAELRSVHRVLSLSRATLTASMTSRANCSAWLSAIPPRSVG